jgi:MFS family permease
VARSTTRLAVSGPRQRTGSPPEQPSIQRLRDDGDFRRYWLSRVTSLSGSVITFVAMPVLVYRLSGSALLTALVTGLEAAPYLLFGLFAGALADRWDRRVVMVIADVICAGVVASVPIAYWVGLLTVPHLLVVAFLGPAIATFFDGANFGALPVLVGRGRVAQANAAVWGAQTAIEIALPSLVGFSLAVIYPADLLALDALSFAASAICVAGITRPLYDSSRAGRSLSVRGLLADIGEGLTYLVHHAGVRTMTIIGTVQCMAGGGFVALMVVWCDRVLHVGTQGLRFGLVFGSWSVGALIASALLPQLLKVATAARIALYAVPVSTVLGAAVGLAPNWQLATVGLLGWGAAYMLVVVNTISYRQQVTPEPLLGRVNTAGRMLSWGVGWTLGAVAGGVLSHQIGVRPAMVTMASLSVVAVLVAWTSPLRTQGVLSGMLEEPTRG